MREKKGPISGPFFLSKFYTLTFLTFLTVGAFLVADFFTFLIAGLVFLTLTFFSVLTGFLATLSFFLQPAQPAANMPTNNNTNTRFILVPLHKG